MQMHHHPQLTKFEVAENLKDFKSSSLSLLKLYMGPYEANGIIRHRIQRLKGLQEALSKCGYNVELVPTAHLNRFSMEFYEREIFRCNIKNFQFNLPAEEDPLCMKILLILKEHENRFSGDENIPRFVSIKHGMRFLQTIKFLTTANQLSGSDIELLFEIKKIESEAKEIIPTPVESETSDNFVYGYETKDITFDMESKNIAFHEKSCGKSISIMEENQGEPRVKIDIRTSSEEPERSERELSNECIEKQNQDIRKLLLFSLKKDSDDELMEHKDIFERASKSLRIRRASHIFRSGEIKSMDPSGSLYGSGTIDDTFAKPYMKNQKIISKVMQYRHHK